MKKTVIELFGGVGGFRVGLNKITTFNFNTGLAKENNTWDFVWTNQWEPSTKSQPAFECYEKRFGKSSNHVNKDISTIDKNEIPKHNLLVGGFPCQDYSVARSLSKEKGINGKKGVLWWEIYKILEIHKTPFVLLENVDRLLKSPSTQRGRDFGIMLKALNDLGYGVEWRVINAAHYGFPQRRRRVFIFAFHNSTKYYSNITKFKSADIIYSKGLFSKQFPINKKYISKHKDTFGSFTKFKDIFEVSEKFNTLFRKSGIMLKGNFYSIETEAKLEQISPIKNILCENLDESLYISNERNIKFEYLKGSKNIPRKRPDGSIYFYTEGKMTYPENINLPGRTMLTSEGTTNRSTHIIEDSKGKRFLSPIEAERLNMFPDDWTNSGMTKRQRYFMMGNALVCGIVSRIGDTLEKIFENE